MNEVVNTTVDWDRLCLPDGQSRTFIELEFESPLSMTLAMESVDAVILDPARSVGVE